MSFSPYKKFNTSTFDYQQEKLLFPATYYPASGGEHKGNNYSNL